jgi:hypothetical protein
MALAHALVLAPRTAGFPVIDNRGFHPAGASRLYGDSRWGALRHSLTLLGETCTPTVFSRSCRPGSASLRRSHTLRKVHNGEWIPVHTVTVLKAMGILL